MGMDTFVDWDTFRSKTTAENGKSFKVESVGWGAISTFTLDCESVIAEETKSGVLALAFRTDYLRGKLKHALPSIQETFRHKAKRHGTAYVRVGLSNYRSYVILSTAANQVVTWGWWINEQTKFAYDLEGTFPD